ncbi:MAG: phosphoglucosamine mutase [Bacteroidota bacterium]
MALIKSISGIRGTIGGKANENLTPQDIVECTAAFGTWSLRQTQNPKIVIGRDARISGQLVNQLVVSTLQMIGLEVIDLGLSTTPTVEMAVVMEKAGAGIILTASHNPKHWNALKFLNAKGEFISAEAGRAVLDLIEKGDIEYASVDQLGSYTRKSDYIDKHIEAILALPLINANAVRDKNYTIIVDAVNSTGALAIPPLLERLGCECVLINEQMHGDFAHNPEPLPEHLTQLGRTVQSERADLGIAVDPDVDRLAFVCEDGTAFGEEYTLVAVADYVLKHTPGNTVSNLSSTRALRDVTQQHGQKYTAAAVGEVNVVTQMKTSEAVIGGEGNGGIIYPTLHYGRDALVGIALFLSHLATSEMTVSRLRQSYPDYHIVKNKIQLSPEIHVEKILSQLEHKYRNHELNTVDGLKIDLEDGWIHLRKSNTEPIIRIYTEGGSKVTADNLAKKIMADMMDIIRGK